MNWPESINVPKSFPKRKHLESRSTKPVYVTTGSSARATENSKTCTVVLVSQCFVLRETWSKFYHNFGTSIPKGFLQKFQIRSGSYVDH